MFFFRYKCDIVAYFQPYTCYVSNCWNQLLFELSIDTLDVMKSAGFLIGSGKNADKVKK